MGSARCRDVVDRGRRGAKDGSHSTVLDEMQESKVDRSGEYMRALGVRSSIEETEKEGGREKHSQE